MGFELGFERGESACQAAGRRFAEAAGRSGGYFLGKYAQPFDGSQRSASLRESVEQLGAFGESRTARIATAARLACKKGYVVSHGFDDAVMRGKQHDAARPHDASAFLKRFKIEANVIFCCCDDAGRPADLHRLARRFVLGGIGERFGHGGKRR